MNSLFLSFVFAVLFIPVITIDVMGDVIINEIELGPAIGDVMWIELYNPTDLPVPLEGGELYLYRDSAINTGIVIPLPKDTLIESKEYHLVPLNGSAQSLTNTHNVTVVLLDKTPARLDAITGIGDAAADDRTWQRFPDGVDSGAFTDWTFRTATQGQDNGNMGQLVAECSLDPFCWGPLDVFFHNEHRATVDDRVFLIETFYDTKRMNVDFVLDEKKITISQRPPDFAQAHTRSSFIHVTIPDELLSGTYSVFGDGEKKSFYTVTDQLNNRVIINDIGDTEVIEIIGTRVIPEFSTGVMVLVMVLVFSALVTCRSYASRFGNGLA